MRIKNGRLEGLPRDYDVLFIGSIDGKIYFAIIVSKKKWYEEYQLKNGGLDGSVSGVMISIGENNQELNFKPADSFVINNCPQCDWTLLFEGTRLHELCGKAYFGNSNVPLETIYSALSKYKATSSNTDTAPDIDDIFFQYFCRYPGA